MDIVGLASKLNNIDWSTIFSINNHIEHIWNEFSQNIAALIEKYTPVKPPIRCHLPYNQYPSLYIKFNL